jgi:hypothetical protein
MNNKFKVLLVAGVFAVGITASGATAVSAHQLVDSSGATQVEPVEANDVDNLEVGNTGQTGESVNDNMDDGAKGETGEKAESVNDNKDQKDAGNVNDAQQGQSGDQK